MISVIKKCVYIYIYIIYMCVLYIKLYIYHMCTVYKIIYIIYIYVSRVVCSRVHVKVCSHVQDLCDDERLGT